MKDGALLVNVARGPVVVSDDLVAELATGRIHVALDVFDPEPLTADHPLGASPNVLIIPTSVAPAGRSSRAERLVREQLSRYAHGEALSNILGL